MATELQGVNVVDSDGHTPLYWAVSYGEREVIEYLIQQGADVNLDRGMYGVTPLHAAAQDRDHDMVRLLVEKGADPSAEDHQGRTPLDYASGYAPVVNLLFQSGSTAHGSTSRSG